VRCIELLFLGEEVVEYTEEQIRKAEESIRIRREAEPVELVEAVLTRNLVVKYFHNTCDLID
jgi:hypothetical protein